jgi:hypothetical protein
MPQIHSRIVAHGRTKIAQRSARRPPPIRSRSAIFSHRSQSSQQVGSVQPAFSRLIPRDHGARSRQRGPSHQTSTARRNRLLRWPRRQVLAENSLRIFVASGSPIKNENFILPHRLHRSVRPAHIHPSNAQPCTSLRGERVKSSCLTCNRRRSIRQRAAPTLADSPASRQQHKPNQPRGCNSFHHTPVPPAPALTPPAANLH